MAIVDNQIDSYVRHAAKLISGRYSRWVDQEDVLQEVWLYALGDGAKHIQTWREKNEMHRVRLALAGAAKQFCEQEKAQKSGYHFEDVAWYSPEILADLVPLALDPHYDGITGETGDQSSRRKQTDGREGGTLMAMIADTRKALEKVGDSLDPADYVLETEEGTERLVNLADFLGGEFPNSPGYQRGKRKVMSNAAAQVEIRRGAGEQT